MNKLLIATISITSITGTAIGFNNFNGEVTEEESTSKPEVTCSEIWTEIETGTEYLMALSHNGDYGYVTDEFLQDNGYAGIQEYFDEHVEQDFEEMGLIAKDGMHYWGEADERQWLIYYNWSPLDEYYVADVIIGKKDRKCDLVNE